MVLLGPSQGTFGDTCLHLLLIDDDVTWSRCLISLLQSYDFSLVINKQSGRYFKTMPKYVALHQNFSLDLVCIDDSCPHMFLMMVQSDSSCYLNLSAWSWLGMSLQPALCPWLPYCISAEPQGFTEHSLAAPRPVDRDPSQAANVQGPPHRDLGESWHQWASVSSPMKGELQSSPLPNVRKHYRGSPKPGSLPLRAAGQAWWPT